MKSLSCRDIGVDCDYEAIGHRAEDVKDKIIAHAHRYHLNFLENLNDREKQQMMAKINNMLGEVNEVQNTESE